MVTLEETTLIAAPIARFPPRRHSVPLFASSFWRSQNLCICVSAASTLYSRFAIL
jgi:hypothetical protein